MNTVIIDVDYRDNNTAIASAIIFNDCKTDDVINTYSVSVENILPYESGSFYKRELPCILKVLGVITEFIDLIIIDGYVSLGDENNKGLGEHLSGAIHEKIPIIGIAKNKFQGISDDHEIFRGVSKKPLFITVIDYDLKNAKEMVISMHGENRLPTFVKMVDKLCRESIAS
jgi:deoxyribonuclease V